MINWDKLLIQQKKSIPRWVIFSIDVAICIFSVIAAFLLRFNFNVEEIILSYNIFFCISFVLLFRIISFAVTKTYAGIIRYTGSQDAVRIFMAVSASTLFIYLFDISHYYIIEKGRGQSILPLAVIIIDFIITLMIMTSMRLGYKLLFRQVQNASIKKSRVLIYGAGQMGLITKRALDHDTSSRFKIVAFLDSDPSKVDKTLEGVRIIKGDNELAELIQSKNIDQVIIAIQELSNEKKQSIIEICLANDIKCSTIPPVTKWINGELAINQIKNVKIEDLLGRDAIKLDIENVKKQLSGKTILVTGAAGSIGSEIARQIMNLHPERLLLVDQSETPLYELEFEFKNDLNFPNVHRCEFIVADVCNEQQMRKIFETFKPDKIFHAAAYKHVPLMEAHPSQAIINNVQGTKILADLSLEFHAGKFIMVSTDKAVNPTNVMGASKRIAEIYVQSLNNKLEATEKNHTRFITTRFDPSTFPKLRKCAGVEWLSNYGISQTN
jgi:FlaA1/EpsC-like NDP-sugar epimerase